MSFSLVWFAVIDNTKIAMHPVRETSLDEKQGKEPFFISVFNYKIDPKVQKETGQNHPFSAVRKTLSESGIEQDHTSAREPLELRGTLALDRVSKKLRISKWNAVFIIYSKDKSKNFLLKESFYSYFKMVGFCIQTFM